MAKERKIDRKRRQVLAPTWYGPVLIMNPLGWQRVFFLYIVGWIILFGNDYISLLVAIDMGVLIGVSLFFLFVFPQAVDGKIPLGYRNYHKSERAMRVYNFLVEGAFHRTVASILYALVYAFALKQLGEDNIWEMFELWAECIYAWQIIVPMIVVMAIFYANFFAGKSDTTIHDYHQWATTPHGYAPPTESPMTATKTTKPTSSSSTLMTKTATPPPTPTTEEVPLKVEKPLVSALPERPTNYVRRKSRE